MSKCCCRHQTQEKSHVSKNLSNAFLEQYLEGKTFDKLSRCLEKWQPPRLSSALHVGVGWGVGVAELSTLSLPTWVEDELGCDNFNFCWLNSTKAKSKDYY